MIILPNFVFPDNDLLSYYCIIIYLCPKVNDDRMLQYLLVSLLQSVMNLFLQRSRSK